MSPRLRITTTLHRAQPYCFFYCSLIFYPNSVTRCLHQRMHTVSELSPFEHLGPTLTRPGALTRHGLAIAASENWKIWSTAASGNCSLFLALRSRTLNFIFRNLIPIDVIPTKATHIPKWTITMPTIINKSDKNLHRTITSTTVLSACRRISISVCTRAFFTEQPGFAAWHT